ncbi:hypothetical protein NHX12_011226 [Muraenolepis orangiensis]|uniref:Tudor domain-containing protein n=1 Tax=Muraenolepis orangiensis TaxID=630683 RepID=A0A9Q0DEU1_9TELE|nr:hypothetical protein NHX12_011226 [Muraenolepis orangiensis]
MSQKTSDGHSTNALPDAELASRHDLDPDLPAPYHHLHHHHHHQKQTAAQLLDFLRTHAGQRGAAEAHFTRVTTNAQLQGGGPSTTQHRREGRRLTEASSSPPKENASSPPKENASSPPKENAAADAFRSVPPFRLKRVGPHGALVYSCMVLTNTELWDMGEVVTHQTPGPVEQVAAQQQQSEGEDCHNKTLADDPQRPQCTQATCGPAPATCGPAPAQAVPQRHSTSIPEFEICTFKEMEVVVSHIVTPGNFYIQHPDVMTKQRDLVKDWKGQLFAEDNRVPDIGTLVMAFFSEQQQWCRAQVMKICGVGYLTPDMLALPLQAARVSLADVTPVEGRRWTEQAVSWFKAVVEKRTLYARLHPLGSALSVQLFPEKGKMGAMRRGASLSLRLAQNGHAIHDKMKTVGRLQQSNFQLQMKKQETDWQKYLISCYTERKCF